MTDTVEPSELLYLDGKVQPAVLSGILGINVSALYQDHQKGLFGSVQLVDMTYKEAIQVYRSNLVRSVELKLAKEETNRQKELKKLEEHAKLKAKKAALNAGGGYGGDDDTMHPLMKKKLEQDIKLNRVKEVQAWMRVAEEKKQFLNSHELIVLLEPFMHIIKNVLISLSTDFPETRERVDSCMNNLHAFGEKLVEQVRIDEDVFVDEMLDKELDDELLELSFIPEERD